MAKAGRFEAAGGTDLMAFDDDAALATRAIIDAKDMARRKQRIIDQRFDTATRLGQVPHLALLVVQDDKGTYGVNGISIFSPFTPTKNLPNPKLFLPPAEIIDEEVELYQMTEEDMDLLTRLIAMEQEMLSNPNAAQLPVSYHASDVLARLDDTFGDLSMLTITEQLMVLNLVEFNRVVPSDLRGMNEQRVEAAADANDILTFTDTYNETQTMRKASLEKVQHMEDTAAKNLDKFRIASGFRRKILFLIFLLYCFIKLILLTLHLAFSTDTRVYKYALVSFANLGE